MKRSRPYRFFFGPKDFDLVTRKATDRLWKGVRGGILGVGLIIAFFQFFVSSKAVICCSIWGLIIAIGGLVYLIRAKMYFKKAKPPDHSGTKKIYGRSFNYIVPNYLVAMCILLLAFVALIDVFTLGNLEKGNLIVKVLNGIWGISYLFRANPYLLPVILWYFATRTMVGAYKHAFSGGRKVAFISHDASILKKQKTDKWYKKILLGLSTLVGYLALFRTAIFAAIAVGLFILNIYLFHQHRREDFLYGLFSGYNIIIIELVCLALLFICMVWVTTYSLNIKYPNTVFGTMGKISMTVKKGRRKKKGKNKPKPPKEPTPQLTNDLKGNEPK